MGQIAHTAYRPQTRPTYSVFVGAKHLGPSGKGLLMARE
jgi:hypothetical protein